MGRNQHVVHARQGGWNVRGENSKRVTVHTSTKAEATKIARTISRNQNSELFIHGMDGRIQSRDSHGHDPHPPRGQKGSKTIWKQKTQMLKFTKKIDMTRYKQHKLKN